jgi:hypothetical protein
MAKHVSALALAKALEDRLRKTGASVERSMEIAARETFEEARRNLSGTESQASLNRAGNPFGMGFKNPRGKVRGRRRDLPINRQSGKLARSLYLRSEGTGRGTRYRIGVKGGPRYAAYALGRTRIKRDRGFWAATTKGWKARLFAVKRARNLRNK